MITRSELRGAEVFAAQLSDQLVRRGHEVCLAALYRPPADAAQLLPVQGTRLVQLNGRVQGRIEARVLLRLFQLVRHLRPEVVQANAFHALKYAALLKRCTRSPWPLVYRNISLASGWIRRPWQRRWGVWLLRSVDCVVSVSDASAADICATYGVPRSRVRTLRRGIEVPAESGRAAARQTIAQLIGCEATSPLLFHVGGFTAEKNHGGLLQAYEIVRREHPAARLVLCGDGPLRPQIQASAAALHGAAHVHFLGSRADARELVAGADLLLLTSAIEGIPGVVLEAAAREVPAVCTDVGAVSEAVLHGTTGLLVPAGDMPALGKAAAALVAAPERRRQMGAAARRHVTERHDMVKVIQQFESLYGELLAAETRTTAWGPRPKQS